MKLILLSSPKKIKTEAETVTKLFDNGLEIFHLRKPKSSIRELSDFLQAIPKEYWSRIVIHSHYKLAIKFNLKGIHLTSKYKKKKFRTWLKLKFLKFKKPDLHISTSFHSLSKLYEDTGNYKYVFISPVFDSISKSGYQAGFSEYSLRVALNNCKHNVVALGGVEESKVEQIKDMGFYGMAMLGAIWNSEDQVTTFNAIKHKCQNNDNNNGRPVITPIKMELKSRQATGS